jgi:hypothetical protein
MLSPSLLLLASNISSAQKISRTLIQYIKLFCNNRLLVWNRIILVDYVICMMPARRIMKMIALRLDRFIRSQADVAKFEFALKTYCEH